MNVLERKRGITLIALVITIITILILAGVSINSIIGKNGIVEKAQTTGKIQTVASIKEALELEKGDLLVNSKTVNLNNYLDQISNGDKKYEISSKEIIDDKNAEIIVDDKYKFALKDTEEGDVEVTYQGVAASSDLSISAKSGTYVYPNSGTFTVTNNVSGGELTVSSDATNIATATIEGNTVTVVPGTTAGKANIIVKSSANGDYAENKVVHVATVQNGTIKLSVTPYTGIYDGKVHDAITKINVNPTDAKIEYSIDGENYSETVPTITETSSFTVTVRASKAGYKTQITTETVKVNKAEGKLTLSATSGTLTYPTSGMFTVSENTGTLSVASSNTNIATASINGSTVTVKPGTTAGKATITVTSAEASNYNEKSATYEATVQNGTISLSATPYTGTYDGKVHNAFTSVNVTPSDAKLEYSINGGTYSTTMPTITDTSSFTVTVKASKAGYKTQIKTETVRVNKAAGTLTLSATSGTLTYPTSTTFTVSGNTGTLSVVSNNTNIATVSVSGNTVTVKPGTTAGKATITVTSAEASNYNEKSATYEATVQNGTISLSATPYTGTYDGKAHNAFTSVNVTPSEAKLEYSINGGTYSTTMPTITNTSSFTVTVKASKAGYKTQTTTQTVKVNKAAGTLTLSATSGTLTYPTNATFTVSGNKGTLSVASSNTNIATASISGSTVTVKPGTTAGKATITVTSAATTNYNEKSATYTATVNNGTISLSATPYTGTYDGKAHNAITKVTVTPSDAKIEYSTNGTNYSTTMPTITNTSSFTVTVRASKAGYKTQSTTQTVKVNKAAGTLTLSATSGTLTYPTNATFTVSGNKGNLSVASSNTNIATASISGNTVTVKPGTTAGKATITVTSAATTNYNAKSATYTATVNNGTISLSATPYTGTYDGKAHNAITKVTVTPSDAKIEYSTNGTTYSTTMPKITNTSSFTVTVRASKAGYKTQTTTQTVKVNKAAGTLTLSATSGTLMYPNTTTFTVSGNKGTLSVASSNTNVATASISGNKVTVKSGATAGKATITVTSAATTNYNAKSATYNITVDNINSLKIGDYVNYKYDTAGKYTLGSKYSGDSSEQSISQTTDMKWRILNIDKTTETIDLISEKITNEKVYFNGILGYNNGPYFMNEICKAQYSNKSLGAYARSINLLDMEKHLTTKGIVARSAWSNAVQYGKTKRYTSSSYRYYPSLYINQKGAGVNTTSVTQPDITKGNDPYEESKAIATTEPTTDSSYGKASSTGLTLTQTYYDIDFNSENYGEAASVLPAQPGYWVAARYVLADTKNASWGLRLGTDDSMYGLFLFSSDRGTSSVGIALRPVVSISSRALAGIKDSSGAWNLK